jgi:hypothetical protein
MAGQKLVAKEATLLAGADEKETRRQLWIMVVEGKQLHLRVDSQIEPTSPAEASFRVSYEPELS